MPQRHRTPPRPDGIRPLFPAPMPFRVLHYDDPSLDVVEVFGSIHWSDVAGAMRALLGRPDWVPGTSVLWDATGITALDIAPEALPSVAPVFTEVAEAREGGRSAILLGPEGEDAIWILFPHLGPPSTRKVMVYHDRARALAFLGLEAMPEGGTVVAG